LRQPLFAIKEFSVYSRSPCPACDLQELIADAKNIKVKNFYFIFFCGSHSLSEKAYSDWFLQRSEESTEKHFYGNDD
jgi:hypothetical protein